MNIEDSKYFFWGIDYTYALVDSFDRQIWMLAQDKETAFELQHIFLSKASIAVYDVSVCNNYNRELLDNSICINWQVPPLTDLSYVETSVHNKSFNTVLTSTADLVNSFPSISLSAESKINLQSQLMLAHRIVTNFSADDKKLELYQKIKQILLTELKIDQIENQLLSVIDCYIDQYPVLGLRLLEVLKRNYA